MRSDPVLKKWYRIINRKFFYNELPNNVCVRWFNEDDEDEEERCEEKYFGWADRGKDGRHAYVICLSRFRCDSMTQKLGTLAHEMVHIATDVKDNHGPAFESWRQTLGDRGLFRKGALVKNLTLF
jgi:hypothetical protein